MSDGARDGLHRALVFFDKTICKGFMIVRSRNTHQALAFVVLKNVMA